jgi:uncharacterized membrane protein
MRRKRPVPLDTDFRMRGKQQVSRLECFSDCVFAFALTLIVVSLEVPKSYSELLHAMKGMVAFAFCFAILFGLWSKHHTFFRRYALEDAVTKALTACLLFMVLAYVYPLKFLSLLAINTGLGFDRASAETMFTRYHEAQEVRGLFVLYGGGLFVMSLLFFLFYRYAYSKRKELELNEIEVFDTRWYATEHLYQAAVPAFATCFALIVPAEQIGFAGFSYCLYGLAGYLHGSRFGKRRRMKLAELNPPA